MEKVKFEGCVYLLGDWIKCGSSMIDDIAYYLYLKDIKTERDNWKRIKFETTFVLNQESFLTYKINEKYYHNSKNIIRCKKIKQIKNKNVNG